MTRIYLAIIVATLALLACTKHPAPVEPIAPVMDSVAIDRMPRDTAWLKADNKPIKVKHQQAVGEAVAPHLVIYFASNSVKVSPKYDLPEIARILKANPTAGVTIEGYADTVGSVKYNLKLSERRALSVAKILRSYGVEGFHIFVNGNGELPGNLSKSRKATLTLSL